MPSFTEYLLAPWKVFGQIIALIAGAPSSPGIRPPPNSFCSIQNVGDQILSLCRVFGYEMPSFIFWASLCILLLFAGTSGALYFQCTQLTLVLSRISARLERVPQPKGAHSIAQKEISTFR